MATRKPMVLNSGEIEQLQSGDDLDANTAANSITLTNEQGSALAICQVVYSSSSGMAKLANAGASGTSKPIGLVRDTSIADAASGRIVTDGVLEATTAQWDAQTGQVGGLTSGAIYYLDVTDGKLTVTPPSSSGQFVVRLGVALATTQLLVQIMQRVKL